MSSEAIQQMELIQKRIYLIRGKRMMISYDLAKLYGVAPKVLMQAVKRNPRRFPSDFMIQLTKDEVPSSRSQIVTLNVDTPGHSKRGSNVKHLPYAFTEQGVAMLSSVLHSNRAIQVNIAIMRAFAHLREILANHKELSEKLREVESRIDQHDAHIRTIFEAIQALVEPGCPKEEKRTGY